MNVALRKSLLAAAASLLLAAPLGAQAVYLNSDGIGQALIYPYYTAQSSDGNPFNTYITVINSGTDAKALRVRFREARNGAPVLSFNLFLAPYDAWAGAVVPFGSGARLLTNDSSCTDPPFIVEFAPGSLPFLDFSNAAYAGDGAGDGIERTREGFVEILEMATLTGASAAAVTGAGNDVPPACSGIRGAASLTTAAPSGALSGTLTLINVASGMDFTVRSDALAQLATRSYYRPGADPYPDFNAAEIDAVSTVPANGVVYQSVWGRPVDAVSATLMRSHWLSEFILDNATTSRTDVIVTFPTRSFYITSAGATSPFTTPTATGPSCTPGRGEPFNFAYFNREERFPPCDSCGFTLPPQEAPPPLLCAASTALSIVNGAAHSPAPGASGVMGASSTLSMPLRSGDWQHGWLDISPRQGSLASLAASLRLNTATGAQSAGSHGFSGLPVIGFNVRTFRFNALPCSAGLCQGNYGGAYPLRFRRAVSPAN